MQTIQTESVKKFYGDITACHDITLNIQEGEIYGFLGLNGAGKTTLIRILLGMIKADAGHVKLFGEDVNRRFNNWNNIGYLVETTYSYPDLTVHENLLVYYHLRQLNDPLAIDRIIEQLNLGRFRHKKAKELSLGNQQRLGLAKAMMHHPRLLILDEPINGLDPEGIVEVREFLQQLADNGTTIFLSSHILGEISKLAHRIGIIHDGILITELTINELHNQLTKKLLIKTNDNQGALVELISDKWQASISAKDEIELVDKEAIKHPERISQLLVEKGFPPSRIDVFTENLEMYFLRTVRNHEA